jgi:hypothetical protein
VLQINVTDDQVEDRMAEALFFYQQYHMDAVESVYIQHMITPSTLTLTDVQGSFVMNQRLIGANSQFNAFVYQVVNTSTITYASLIPSNTANFLVGEMVFGATEGNANTNANAIISKVTLGDYDNNYIIVDPSVIGVKRIFAPFDSRISADVLFDPQSQFNMSLLANFTSSSVIPYYIGRSYQQLLNDMFRGRPGIRFQRFTNKVCLDISLQANLPPGYFVIVDGVAVLDPEEYPLIWSDRWLQRYTIALIKRQWGTNLSKYNGIALPGGVTLDGATMYTTAQAECDKLEDELRNTYQEPPMFIVG